MNLISKPLTNTFLATSGMKFVVLIFFVPITACGPEIDMSYSPNSMPMDKVVLSHLNWANVHNLILDDPPGRCGQEETYQSAEQPIVEDSIRRLITSPSGRVVDIDKLREFGFTCLDSGLCKYQTTIRVTSKRFRPPAKNGVRDNTIYVCLDQPTYPRTKLVVARSSVEDKGS